MLANLIVFVTHLVQIKLVFTLYIKVRKAAFIAEQDNFLDKRRFERKLEREAVHLFPIVVYISVVKVNKCVMLVTNRKSLMSYF